MALFSKEKDTLLKLVNAVLVLSLIFLVTIIFSTGIKMINKDEIGSYKQYSKDVCALDSLEYECSDESCIKELDRERKKTCTNFYLKEKKEADNINKLNRENFLVSTASAIIIFLFIHILNKKKK